MRPRRWWRERLAAERRRGYEEGYDAGIAASLRVLQEWRAADGTVTHRVYGNGHACQPAGVPS